MASAVQQGQSDKQFLIRPANDRLSYHSTMSTSEQDIKSMKTLLQVLPIQTLW